MLYPIINKMLFITHGSGISLVLNAPFEIKYREIYIFKYFTLPL